MATLISHSRYTAPKNTTTETGITLIVPRNIAAANAALGIMKVEKVYVSFSKKPLWRKSARIAVLSSDKMTALLCFLALSFLILESATTVPPSTLSLKKSEITFGKTHLVFH